MLPRFNSIAKAAEYMKQLDIQLSACQKQNDILKEVLHDSEHDIGASPVKIAYGALCTTPGEVFKVDPNVAFKIPFSDAIDVTAGDSFAIGNSMLDSVNHTLIIPHKMCLDIKVSGTTNVLLPKHTLKIRHNNHPVHISYSSVDTKTVMAGISRLEVRMSDLIEAELTSPIKCKVTNFTIELYGVGV